MEIIAEVIVELVLSRLFLELWRRVVRVDREDKDRKSRNEEDRGDTSEPDSASSKRRQEAEPPEENSSVEPANESNEKIPEEHQSPVK